MTSRSVTRRVFLGAVSIAATEAVVSSIIDHRHAVVDGRRASSQLPEVPYGGATSAGHVGVVPAGGGQSSGYVPDGTAGLSAAFPLSVVKLLASPLRANQSRNTDYLLFVDPDRLLHTFRLNVGLPSSAQPCGGWEAPDSLVRGHCTGHLMSGLALTYANTGNRAAAEKGRYIVSQLARCQARARLAGFHDGYLSAFPESFFDQARSRPARLGAVLHDPQDHGGADRPARTGRQHASPRHGGQAGRLGGLAHVPPVIRAHAAGPADRARRPRRVAGEPLPADRGGSYLATAERFYHARVFDPLARDTDQLSGLHANTTIPKMISCIRIWEETGSRRYHDIGANFWQIVTGHHSYVIGGTSNYEHWHAPDVVAGQLSNRTCENCCSYNMLKLTRLLHFHQPERIDLLDYYERTLFNQMLGEQDPRSPHGFNIYYTGLSPGAFKQQPPFMGADPNVYSTNYTNFSCDHATGMETQAKFADTIYSRDANGISVNLFIPSEVTWGNGTITLRQTTGFPDEPGTRIRSFPGRPRWCCGCASRPGWQARHRPG